MPRFVCFYDDLRHKRQFIDLCEIVDHRPGSFSGAMTSFKSGTNLDCHVFSWFILPTYSIQTQFKNDILASVK